MFESSNPWKNPTTESMCDALVSQIIKDNSDITNVRDADAAKKAAYAETLAQFETQRGGALWYPYIGSGRGNGALVELRDGSIKYDLISGIGKNLDIFANTDFV